MSLFIPAGLSYFLTLQEIVEAVLTEKRNFVSLFIPAGLSYFCLCVIVWNGCVCGRRSRVDS